MSVTFTIEIAAANEQEIIDMINSDHPGIPEDKNGPLYTKNKWALGGYIKELYDRKLIAYRRRLAGQNITPITKQEIILK